MTEARPKKPHTYCIIPYIKNPTNYKLIYTGRADQRLPGMGGEEGGRYTEKQEKRTDSREAQGDFRGDQQVCYFDCSDGLTGA